MGATALNIIIFGITTLCKRGSYMTLSKKHSAWGHELFPNEIIPNVKILNPENGENPEC
jgi:hypothetical protein